MSFSKMIRQPGAFLPVAMSSAALAMVLGHVAMFGAALEADQAFRQKVLEAVPGWTSHASVCMDEPNSKPDGNELPATPVRRMFYISSWVGLDGSDILSQRPARRRCGWQPRALGEAT
jgi:hypothetical protein